MVIIRWIFCLVGLCLRCRPVSDDVACWGECIDCGKQHGRISRLAIRKYIEARELGGEPEGLNRPQLSG